MIGNIHLIKVNKGKVVPALCIKSSTTKKIFLQLRSASEMEMIFQKYPKKYKRMQRGRPMCKQESISKNIVYIDKPNGLKNESVVMVNKLYIVEQIDILKKISEIPIKDLNNILERVENIQNLSELHKKMHLLKKKILIAQMNNTKYSDLENQLNEVIKELGFTSTHNTSREGKAVTVK